VEAGVGFSVFMIAMLIAQYSWGILSDYLPRKYTLTIFVRPCWLCLLIYPDFSNEPSGHICGGRVNGFFQMQLQQRFLH
jgi:MFS family permease